MPTRVILGTSLNAIGGLSMDRTNIAQRIERGLMVFTLAVWGGRIDFARHGLSETCQWRSYCVGYPRRCAARSGHCVFKSAKVLRSAADVLPPYAPPVYSAVPAPVYSHAPPPPAYYPPVPYNAPGFYYSGY
jgi:hypothetical protein